MKKTKAIILAVILLAIVVGGKVYDYTFNSKHRDIANEEATLTLSANELFAHFQSNELSASMNYLDKVIEINGKVTAIEDDEAVLDDQIQVRFLAKVIPKKAVNNGVVTIKGRCVGYDELLEVVKIDQATLIIK